MNLQEKHLQLLQDEAKLRFQVEELEEKCKELDYYRKFHDTAIQGIQIFDKTPDLLSEVRGMPNMYKESLIEYIDLVIKETINKALDQTENQLQLLFINGIRVGCNQIVKNLLGLKTPEKEGYTLITRQKLQPKKPKK